MSQQTVIEALNRMMEIECYSLVDYLSEAPPWTHPGNEELIEVTRNIVSDHQHYSQLLADAIEERDGILDAGTFPMWFPSLNDLALDYLLVELIENQQCNIQVNEQCVAELSDDPLACSVATEVLGSKRVHLEVLQKFLPQTEPASRYKNLVSRKTKASLRIPQESLHRNLLE